MSNCVFCKIISGESPEDILHQDDRVIVFKDIKPVSKHHYLSIPREHIININYLKSSDHKDLVVQLIETGKKILQDNGGNIDDVRIGFHCPPFNSVGHLHLHVISPASEMSFYHKISFRPNTWWFQSMSNCAFCKIISGESAGEILHQDDRVVVFKDIKPASKHHYLSVPREHIININYLNSSDHRDLLVQLMETGKKILQDNGGNIDDVRLGFHCPPFNSVAHLHLHVISPASEMSFYTEVAFKPNTWWFKSADQILEKLDSDKGSKL